MFFLRNHAKLSLENIKLDVGLMMDKKGKVIPIPGLTEKLFHKGIDAIQTRQFSDAINLLEQAKDLGYEHEELYFALIVAYMEKGNFSEAKKLCHELLKNGIGDYVKTVELYVSILFQMHEYQEIEQFLRPLMEENEIPIEKIQQFQHLLQLSERMGSNQTENTSEDRMKDLFTDDFQETLHRVSSLADKNIQPYIKEIKNYLANEQASPFIKTVLLNILREHEYSKKITVHKYGQTFEVCPNQLFSLQEDKNAKSIKNILRSKLENDNPTLLESLLVLIDRFFFHIYPIEVLPYNHQTWSAAFYAIAQSYFDDVMDMASIAQEYQCNKEEMEEVIRYIQKVDINSNI